MNLFLYSLFLVFQTRFLFCCFILSFPILFFVVVCVPFFFLSLTVWKAQSASNLVVCTRVINRQVRGELRSLSLDVICGSVNMEDWRDGSTNSLLKDGKTGLWTVFVIKFTYISAALSKCAFAFCNVPKRRLHTHTFPISLLWRVCPFNWSSVKMSFRHWESVCTALRWRYRICYHRCNLQITPETREASSVQLSKEDRKNVAIFRIRFLWTCLVQAWWKRSWQTDRGLIERGYFSLCFSCNKTACLLHNNTTLFLLFISCVLWGCCCCACRVLLWLCGGGLWREDVHCSGHPPCRHRRATGKAGTGHQSAGQGAAQPGRNTASQSPAAVHKTAVTYW